MFVINWTVWRYHYHKLMSVVENVQKHSWANNVPHINMTMSASSCHAFLS